MEDFPVTEPILWVPPVCTERETGGFEDCTWATGVMAGNFVAQEMKHPHTRWEYEGLRVDGGEQGREGNGDGSNYGQLATGLRKRYGIEADLVSGSDAVDMIPVGAGAGVQGLYSALPARLRVTAFTGGHSVLAVRRSLAEFAWLDPLKPNLANAVVASLEEVRKYFRALGGAQVLLVYPHMTEWRNRMIKINFQRYKAVTDTPVHEAPSALSPKVTKIGAGREFTSVGVPMDRSTDKTPFLASGWRAVLVSTGAVDSTLAPKIAYVQTGTLTGVGSSGDWDAALLKALGDIAFRGETTVEVPVQDPALVAELDALKAAKAAWEARKAEIISLLSA
jgi:hypothetical protein